VDDVRGAGDEEDDQFRLLVNPKRKTDARLYQ
jgi:hypothetical protein